MRILPGLVCVDKLTYSQIYLSWFTGIRLLIEGNVINPYIFGDRGFWQVFYYQVTHNDHILCPSGGLVL